MNEKLKGFLKTIGIFLAGLFTGLIGFFIRRRDVSNIRKRIDEIDGQLGSIGDGISKSETASDGIARLTDEGAGAVADLENQLRQSRETTDALTESLARQSERIRESSGIINSIKKRGVHKPE